MAALGGEFTVVQANLTLENATDGSGSHVTLLNPLTGLMTRGFSNLFLADSLTTLILASLWQTLEIGTASIESLIKEPSTVLCATY